MKCPNCSTEITPIHVDGPTLLHGECSQCGLVGSGAVFLSLNARLEGIEGQLRDLRPYGDAASDPWPVELPPYATARRDAIDAFEKTYLCAILRRYSGLSEAARCLGLDRAHMHRMLKRHNLWERKKNQCSSAY